MILRGKNLNNLKSFQIHIFTIQNILYIFFKKNKKKLFSCGQGVFREEQSEKGRPLGQACEAQKLICSYCKVDLCHDHFEKSHDKSK